MTDYRTINERSLFEFYDKIGSDKDRLYYSKKENYSFVKARKGVWPNVIYRFDAGFQYAGADGFDSTTIAVCLTDDEAAAGMVPASFRQIDLWKAMHINLAGKKFSLGECTPVYRYGLASDIEEWCTFVAGELFAGRELDSAIFSALPHTELIEMRDDKEIVASALVYLHNDGIASIYMVSVKRSFRGKGLGRALMLYCLALVQEKGYHSVVLQSTRMGIKLYESLDFQSDGEYGLFYKIA